MTHLADCFAELKSAGRKALIPFITAGDPKPDITVPLMHRLVAAGANVIELGVPFSDPMADGPVIQKASERALVHNVSLTNVLEMVKQFRETDIKTPVVLMGYLNPVEIMGIERFAAAAQAAGVSGLLTVDLPPEEAEQVVSILRKHQIDPIFLIAPTTTQERIKKISEQASGFIYYVSVKGVTGSSALDVSAVAEKMTQIREYTDLPIGVGFGIKNAESAAKVSQVADAVVVGSALVQLVETTPEATLIESIGALAKSMRDGMDA
jgi:tryptophan synthase alpha chain